MQYITLNELQTNIKTVFSRVSDDREPLAISLDKNRSVVVVDLDDYNSLMETIMKRIKRFQLFTKETQS